MDEQNTKDMFINPYYAVNFSPIFAQKHEPMTTKENWVKVNLKLMDELGNEEWLNRLLHVLETGEPHSSRE